MSLRTIITAEDHRLRQRARKVRTVSPAVRSLIEDMVDTMRAAPGVGLAATQLAVDQRVIVVEYRDDEQNAEAPPKLFTVVNPDITHRSSEMVEGVEGCLSIPGYAGDVERHAWVTVKGLNRHGRPFRLKARGWLARIFQHEIDHLDGVLFIDRATHVWKLEPEGPPDSLASGQEATADLGADGQALAQPPGGATGRETGPGQAARVNGQPSEVSVPPLSGLPGPISNPRSPE